MSKFKILFLIAVSFAFYSVSAQTNYKIKGQVVDTDAKTPMVAAAVKLLNDSNLKTGTLTKDDGTFELSTTAGLYQLEIEYIGYKKVTIAIVQITNNDVFVPNVVLEAENQNLKEVVVTAEKSNTEMSLDKRVFNVGKDLANAGGSAQDILVNVPSVTVDPDGGIKLRGSSNVRILIDGKPSGMVSFKGGAGLRQLQASMIEKVEVITNPSARYEAEGQAGIINIILKKDNKQGFNGSYELITGMPTNFGAAANINYRKKQLNFFINYSLAYRSNPYLGNMYQEVKAQDTLRILEQTNTGTVSGFDNNIRGGIEYYFNEKSVLTGSYLFSRAGGKRYTENIYNDFINTLSHKLGTISRVQHEVEKEPMSEYVISYKKEFKTKSHELNAQFRFLDHFENSDQTFTQKGTLDNGTLDPANNYEQTSINDEFEKQYLLQLDYQKPLKKDSKIELGARASWRDMVNDYVVSDVTPNGEVPISQFDNYFVYNEKINAVYGIFSDKKGKFSYQIGLRAENTNVNTLLQKTNERNPRQYANLFPTIHTTYAINELNSLQLSYSKRIKRPVYNDLSPFATFSDNRNFFSGNPNLNPEYSNVYELGHLLSYDKGTLSSSIYHRNTINTIFSIRRVNSLGLSTLLPENLNSEKDYGVDFTASYNPFKWWKMDGNINVFNANIDGGNIEKSYVVSTNTWFARHTSRFTIKSSWDIQVRANYEAAQKTAQGSRKAIFFTDFSLKKSLWQKKGALNLSILDVFNSRWSRIISTGPGFYTLNNRQFRPRQINLTLSYRIKQ